MEREWIADLAPGKIVGVYGFADLKRKATKKGAPYASFRLFDSSGSLRARLWQAGDAFFDVFADERAVRIEGQVETWQGERQIVVRDIEPVVPDEELLEALVEEERVDVEALAESIREILESIEDEDLAELVFDFFDDEAWFEAASTMPGSAWNHHRWKHGYFAHLLSVLKQGVALCEVYDWVDRDLVLAGLFVHDCGKLEELEWSDEIEYSVKGRLLGHIPLGLLELTRRASAIEGFCEERLLQLQHVIISHHESAKLGSAKFPAFPEAELIRAIEALDARMDIHLQERVNAATLVSDSPLVESAKLRRWLYFRPEGESGDQKPEA